MGLLRGFDVSHWQGSEDWARWVRDYGIRFGAAKATQGETYVDPRFGEHWRGMRAAGLVRIAYDFAQPDADPRNDVAHLLRVVDQAGGLDPTDLLVLDLERSTLSGTATSAWACAWADELKRATGGRFAAVLYCGGYMDLKSYRPLRSHFDVWWYPRYPARYDGRVAWPTSLDELRLPSPNVWGGRPQFWQFSQSFPAGGEPHDADVFDGTETQLRTLNPGTRPGAGNPDDGGIDVALTDDDVERIAQRTAELVWDHKIETRWQDGGGYDPARPVQQPAAKLLAAARGVATAAAVKVGVRLPG